MSDWSPKRQDAFDIGFVFTFTACFGGLAFALTGSFFALAIAASTSIVSGISWVLFRRWRIFE